MATGNAVLFRGEGHISRNGSIAVSQGRDTPYNGWPSLQPTQRGSDQRLHTLLVYALFVYAYRFAALATLVVSPSSWLSPYPPSRARAAVVGRCVVPLWVNRWAKPVFEVHRIHQQCHVIHGFICVIISAVTRCSHPESQWS